MTKPKTDALRSILARATSVIRLVRPVDLPIPPYKTCAGCGHGGRNDQHVPDPDQYVTKKGVTRAGDVVGNVVTVPVAPVKDVEVKLIDAAPVWCAPCGRWFHAVKCYSLHRTGAGADD